MRVRPLEWARRWHQEGFVTDDGLRVLEARHGDDEGNHLTTALFAGAAAVLAAALLAIPLFADLAEREGRVYLIIVGTIVAITAALLWWRTAAKPAFEAGAITAAALLVPGSLMYLSGDVTSLFAWAVAGLGAACLFAPTRTVLVPTTGLIVLHLCGTLAAYDAWGAQGFWLWLALALATTALAFLGTAGSAWEDRHALLQLMAPILLGGATAAWWAELAGRTVDLDAMQQVVVALVQAPALALAFMLRARPVLIGSVAVIAVDAVVFGFQIGELAVGIPMLLAVAGGLVALALWARRVDGAQA